MNILLLGARGFIGRHVAAALVAAGHRVTAGERPAMDLARDLEAATWLPRLEGIDVVVNAAGIVRESASATFEAVHAVGPSALFEACAARGVRVVQVSALGAASDAPTAFLRSKHRGDEALLALGVPCAVLQPSLVFGPGGASATLFLMMASLPLLPLPAGGLQVIQPVHVDDVAQAITRIVSTGRFLRERVPLVGPAPLSLRDFLACLRQSMGLAPVRTIRVPAPIVGVAASLGVGMLDRDTWTMLQRGSTADPVPLAALLGRAARPPADFISPAQRALYRRDAALEWLLPLMRLALALVWLAAAVVSAGLYPVDASLEMLARVGLEGAAATLALYGAALLDLVLAVATLWPRRPCWLWGAQAALVVAYTGIITWALPEQWLHPFGAVVKNLPILAALAMLHHLERR